MKTFAEVNVFLPSEKDMENMQEAYSIFSRMIQVLIEQVNTKTYRHGVHMGEYAQESWFHFAQYYSLKLFSEDNLLHVALTYMHEPICYVNCDSLSKSGVCGSSAAYILMIAFINHLGDLEVEP